MCCIFFFFFAFIFSSLWASMKYDLIQVGSEEWNSLRLCMLGMNVCEVEEEEEKELPRQQLFGRTGSQTGRSAAWLLALLAPRRPSECLLSCGCRGRPKERKKRLSSKNVSKRLDAGKGVSGIFGKVSYRRVQMDFVFYLWRFCRINSFDTWANVCFFPFKD